MQHGAGFKRRALGQIHDKFHAHRPIPRVMAFGQAEVRVQLLAHGTDRAVGNNRKRGMNVHAGGEAVCQCPFSSTPWSSKRTPTTLYPSMSACDVMCPSSSENGCPGQIWTVPVL